MAGIGSRKLIKVVDETPTKSGSDWEPGNTTIYRGYADVRSVGVNQSVQYSQTQIQKFFEFRFRWQSEITLNAHCKVIYNGQKYKVASLEREREKSFYWIIRTEGRNFN